MITKNPINRLIWLSLAFPTALFANPTASSGSWTFTAESFYAQATDSLLSNSIVAVKVPDPMILGDFKKEYHLDLDDAWGERFVLRYIFPSTQCASYSVSLGYTIFNNTDSTYIQNDNRNSAGLPVIAPAEFIDITDESSARFSIAKTSLTQHYSAVDLLSEKNIVFCNSEIALFAGARYFHMSEKLSSDYFFNGTIGTVRVLNEYKVDFNNDINTIGPELGAGIYFPFCHGLGIQGRLAGAILFGQSKSHFDTYNLLRPTSALGDPRQLSASNEVDDSAHVVPAFSGRLGINYQFPMVHCVKLKLEAGYSGDIYFNALNEVAYQQLLAGDDINSHSNYQNLYLSGPYINLMIRTNR